MTLITRGLFEVDFSQGHRAMIAAQSFEQATKLARQIATARGTSRGEVVGVRRHDLFEATDSVWIEPELL